MNRFSHKVNKRRRIREKQRRSVRHLIAPDPNSSDDTTSRSSCHQSSLSSSHESSFYEPSMETLVNDCNSASSNINFIHDDNHDTDNDDGQWMNINGDEYNNDNRPLYSGSSINVSDAIHRIIGFSLDAN